MRYAVQVLTDDWLEADSLKEAADRLPADLPADAFVAVRQNGYAALTTAEKVRAVAASQVDLRGNVTP